MFLSISSIHLILSFAHKSGKMPKKLKNIRHYNSRTIRRSDFRFETLSRFNNIYPNYISDFKFCAHKWARCQEISKHNRHYTSRTIREREVRFKHQIGLITVYPQVYKHIMDLSLST